MTTRERNLITMKKRKLLLLIPALLLGLLTPAAAADDVTEILGVMTTGNSITITFEDCGASYYEICRATRERGAYIRIGTAEEATYKDTGLRSGQVYFYRVRPCWDEGSYVRRGAYSTPVGASCVNVVSAMAVRSPCYQQGRTIHVSGLMLHSVGCAQENGAVFASLWNQETADVLVHAVVSPGGTVYQLADWERRCWHCGGSGNDTMIGVEMTEPNELIYTSGDDFTWSGDARETAVDNYNTAVALFANLCFLYDLDPMRDICSHREGSTRGIASGHGDPEHLWTGLGLHLTMDTFRQDVRRMMLGGYRAKTVQECAGAAATVTADVLNVRSGPGTTYEVLSTIRYGQSAAILETRWSEGEAWGRLTSGGWICLSYTA